MKLNKRKQDLLFYLALWAVIILILVVIVFAWTIIAAIITG